jgi:Domain of unknown function (DUF4365)
MKKDLDYFIDKRAKDLAVMHMTRHPDLRIERCPDDLGLDILATIVRDQHPTGRMFGLQVRGQDRAIATLKELALASPVPDTDDVNDFPFPVCELLFTMEDDRGYYRWIKSPTRQNLRLTSNQDWMVLDQVQLDQMFMNVNHWYDGKNRSAA